MAITHTGYPLQDVMKVTYKVGFSFIFFFLILLTHIFYWNHFNLSLTGVYLALLLGYVLLVAEFNQFSHRSIPLVIKVFTFFYLYALASVFWSSDVSFTLFSSSLLLCALLSMLFGFYSSRILFESFLEMVIVFSLFLSVVNVYEVYALNAPRPVGLLDNWNTNAAYIVFATTLLSAVYLGSSRQNKIMLGLGLAVLVFAVSLTKSRGAFLSLSVALLFFAYLTFTYQYSWRRYFGVLLWSGFGLITESILRGGVLHRVVDSIQNHNHNFTSGRISLWDTTIQLYLHKPLAGIGYGALWLRLPSDRFLLDNTPIRSTHNDYLQVLAELGPVGAFLFVFFAISVFMLFRRILARQAVEKTITVESAIWVALAGVMIHAFFTYHFYQLSMLVLFGFFVGHLLKRLTIEEGTSVYNGDLKSHAGSYLKFLKFGLVGICLLWFSLGLISSVLLNQSKSEGTFEEASAKARYATLFAPWNSEALLRQANILYEQIKNTGLEDDAKYLLALNLVEKAKILSGLNGNIYALKAELMQLDLQRFKFNDVVEQFSKAIKINPYSLKNRNAYAQFLIKQGQYVQARKVLQEGWGHYYPCNLNLIHEYLNQYKYVLDKLGKNTDNLKQLITRVNKVQEENITCSGVYMNKSLPIN